MDQERLAQIRKQKGFEIANKIKIVSQDGIWLVPSRSHPDKNHIVTLGLKKSTCTCDDYTMRVLPCKHIYAVQIRIAQQLSRNGPKLKERPTYPQNWGAYNKAQTQEKNMFMKLLHELCLTLPEEVHEKRKGRPTLSMSDMIFSSGLKTYTTFSLRRFMTDINAAKYLSYVKHVPHFTMVAEYMRKKEMTPILQDLITLSAMPLKTVETEFAIDSSGLRTTRFNEYCNDKHEMERKHHWLKAHICCGVKTHVITAVNVTEGSGSDSVQFMPLATQTQKSGFQILEMSADKAYLSTDNLSHIARMGGTAFIPFKSDTAVPTPDKQYTWKKMYNYFTFNREELMQHYHKRSNVESTFSMLKARFTDLIRSNDETAQINEVLLKVLCHNICVLVHEMFELGIEPKFMRVGV